MKYFQLLIVIFTQSLFAQAELKCVVEGKNITPNNLFSVDFILNEQEDNFTPPDFKKTGLELVYGPTTSTAQTYENGVSSFSKTLSYVLKSSKAGTFSIGSATMEIEEKIYKSKPITVKIENLVKDEAFYNDYYLVAETDKDDFCYNLTEPIFVTYKLYYNINLKPGSIQLLNNPGFTDFVAKKYTYDKPAVSEQIFKGKAYAVYSVYKVVVYPDEVGKFEFDSLGINLKIKKSDKIIKGKKPTFTTIDKKAFSNKLKIEVCNQLPKNPPDSYSGAFGKFTIKTIKPNKELFSNEPFDIKIEISGDGNFDGFKFPNLEYEISPVESDIDLKTLKTDVKIDNQLQNGAKFGILAKQTKTVTLKSAVIGKQRLLPITFSFFNPETRNYETVTTAEVVLEIK